MLGGFAVSALVEKRLNNGDRSDFINQFFADLEVKRQQKLVDANASKPRTTKMSDLQRQILAIALRWRGKACGDVYIQDIKVEVFGWKPMSHYSTGWFDEGHNRPGTARSNADDPDRSNGPLYGQIFDRKSIGTKEYNSVSVSVSRALKRLIDRHLLYQSGAGWSLTEHGLEVAKTTTTATQC